MQAPSRASRMSVWFALLPVHSAATQFAASVQRTIVDVSFTLLVEE